MKLTAFGKRVRQLRIEADLLMMDQAKGLGVSTTYVSATEIGTKQPSIGYVQKIIEFFAEKGIHAEDLIDLADQAREEIRLNIADYSSSDKSLVSAFARQFSEMTDSDKTTIRDLLKLHGDENATG